MLITFLKHQFTAFRRSRNTGTSIAVQIVMALLILYFLLLAIGVGFLMNMVIQKLYPGSDSVYVFNGFIIYYFLLDFIIRIQFQELPTLAVQPYLHLNIKRKEIVRFLNIKGILTALNLFPLFIFIPFILTKISAGFGANVSLFYVTGLLGLIAFNNYLVLYVKRKSIARFSYLVAGVSIVAALGALEFFHVISLTAIANSIFQAFVQYPVIALVFPVMAVVIIQINSSYLYRNLYIEELRSSNKAKASTEYSFLNRFGRTGELAALELKLILRHKRSKSVLYMGFLFLAYGFLFYKPELLETNQFSMMLFSAIFITGIFIIMYGQFMFAWQSQHFDGLLANKIDFKNFIKAKFLLFTIASVLVTLLSTFYGFMSWKLVLLHICAFLYNLGIGAVLVLLFACYNYKRLDLSKGGSFNWQGTGATQWILGFPLLLIPIGIYVPFGMADKPFWGILTVGMLGLISLLMRNFWVNVITRIFIKQRYKIAEGFRE